ncbi:MAG: FadR/GntR family transcriptional regulator [Lachnospiraceae bacterium]|nr:FadR/GntR family transcriptional regulator [Lachnospiraceae bacterium]
MEKERINVTNQIIEYLRRNIEAGEWKKGEKIPSENQLTRELGVSRASVRTAIQHLNGIGALESVHGKGTYLINSDVHSWGNFEDVITVRDCRDIAKVLEFRQILEPEACYLAVKQKGPELVPVLEHYLEEMKQSFGSKQQFVQADLKFHEAIVRSSGNPLLEKSMAQVFRETVDYHEKMNDLFGYQEGLKYHSRILQAVKDRDGLMAKEMMYEHMQSGIDRLNL